MTVFQLALIYDRGQRGNFSQFIASHPHASGVSGVEDHRHRGNRKSLTSFSLCPGVVWCCEGAGVPSLARYSTWGFEWVGRLRSLGFYFNRRTCSVEIPLCLVLSCAIVSILWRQANIAVDGRGCALLTDYGLAPINFDPNFTVAATPGAVGTSGWLAPIINPLRRGDGTPRMESKTADVFAIGMFAVEVLTGKIPFEEQENEAIVLRISEGGRPEMPENTQTEDSPVISGCSSRAVGSRIPRNDPRWKRWEKFVENNNEDKSFYLKCVQITLVIWTSFSVSFSTS